MISEDFALYDNPRREWNDFYIGEIVNNEMFKTLFFRYKNKMYQFQSIAYKNGEMIDGVLIGPESYMFFEIKGEYQNWDIASKPIYFKSFKEAVDNAKMEDGKTFKEIWDEPDSEVLDFM